MGSSTACSRVLLRRRWSASAVTWCLLVLLHAGPARAQAPCAPVAARVVSVQGAVELRRAGTDAWAPAMLEDGLCSGDALRVAEASRAALALANDSLLRLDQRTTLQLGGGAEEARSLLELLFGAVYFFSHRPRALEVETPFVNAAAEGTEFLVRVGDDRAEVVMLDGRVLLRNALGELRVASGEAALVREGAAPAPMLVVRPRDAVAWALYYPPVLAELAAPGAPPRPLPPGLQAAVERVADNDYAGALQALDAVPEAMRDARYYTYLAGVLLNVGRVEAAERAIERALALDPEAGEALAERAIIHVVQNRRADALADARRAVELSPESSAARIALSYALQAAFQLEEAREVLREAVARNPQDALAWARLAELELMFGELDAARDAAEQAVALAPDLSRTQMVLGFAALTRIDLDAAKAAFARAIALDSANPLPRLGLGLAKIRQSDLAEGRHEIEVAAALAPTDALIRSYLGKAYFEERRDPQAGEQYAIAKELDPNDPTPWFYDAIRLQLDNRPVEALRSLEKSIALNDNRAPFRSRLLLEEDAATRQISLARIYDDLGFEQRGLVEATKSLSLDPANYSAHRFLSDTYARLPRHEIARASELLRAQLLQPITINPIQPSLQVFDLNVVEGSGPPTPGFNEFNQLFAQNGIQLDGTVLVGNNSTFGDDVIASALWNDLSLAVSQFHSETEGFRRNADINNNIYDVLAQWASTPTLSFQAEFRRRETDQGDITLNFDPDDFFRTLREDIRQNTYRTGATYKNPALGTFLLSGLYTDFSDTSTIPELGDFEIKDEEDGYQIEGQHILQRRNVSLTSGAGGYSLDQDLVGGIPGFSFEGPTQIEHWNLYTYAEARYPTTMNWTLGLSYDDYKEQPLERDKINPKLGLLWQLHPKVSLRLAALRTLARARSVNQTIEPTTVSGFNQYFDDFPGTEAWQYAAALDVNITPRVSAGIQYSFRDLDGPILILDDVTEFETAKQDEVTGKIYAYWTPLDQLALSISGNYERFKQTPTEPEPLAREEKVDTIWVPLAARYFARNGLFGSVSTTAVYQEVKFEATPSDDDFFIVLDAEVGYRLPRRAGVISLGVFNLLDEGFSYQDVNFRTRETTNAKFVPERTVLARLTLNF
jgi:tetratricopeptide (TPR) repeat protein